MPQNLDTNRDSIYYSNADFFLPRDNNLNNENQAVSAIKNATSFENENKRPKTKQETFRAPKKENLTPKNSQNYLNKSLEEFKLTVSFLIFKTKFEFWFENKINLLQGSWYGAT